MGNHHTSGRHACGAVAGKIVLPDGTARPLDRPMHAAELMLDHPQHYVIEFKPSILCSGARPIPLPADHLLDPRKAYLMVGVRPGKVSVGSGDVRRVLDKAKAKTSTARILPMTSGVLMDGQDRTMVVEEVVEERPEFLGRQVSGKAWRPSLDAIEERELAVHKKIKHWLF
ncbi:hypothetical protein QJS10_CPA16g01637 [Acorus calamus]|uniref:Uncharacterized protein n=1 Tax=Acorus calamus TaxID=4465 RepID=A0AAV9CYN1_ACOCL|nr:hypothetical protein QJS10_CPA16g01637 [Acorus calamus]